jgi:hypothetical protein
MSAEPLDLIDDSGDGGDADTPVIDLVLASRDRDEYVLVLVEDRPWSEAGVVDHLSDRVNRCVSYVVGGQLTLEFPETVGRDIRIDVRFDHEPTDAVETLFARFADALAQQGLDFSAERLGPPPLGPLPVSDRTR